MPDDLDWLKSWVAENNPSATQEPEHAQKVSELRDLMATEPGRQSADESTAQEPAADRKSPVSDRLSELRDRMAAVPGPESTKEPSRRKPRSRREWDPSSDPELTACMRLELSAQKAAAQRRESAEESSRRKRRGQSERQPSASQRVSELRNLIAAVPDRASAEEPARRAPRSRTGRKPAADREHFDDHEPATDRKAKFDRKSAVERDPASRARDICLNLLTARPRTRSELRQALLRKEIPAEVADQVLSRLDDVGLIDDKAFAEMWVHSRHTYQGMGPRALAVELRRRGVDNDIAAEAVAAVDSDAEEERARQLVRKRLPSMSTLDQQAKIRRLVGMLARKGYSQGLAYRVVKDELANLGEDTNLLDTLD